MNNDSPKRFLWVAASCMTGRSAGPSMALSPEPVAPRCPTLGFAQTAVPKVQIRNSRNAIRIRSTVPVAPVAFDYMQFVQGKARLAVNMWNCGGQRIKLADVVAVRTSQDDRERDALRVDDQVVLAAELAPVGRVRTGFFPQPPRERTNCRQWCRARSNWPRRRRSAGSVSRMHCQTPASCHATSRRQQAVLEPQPISCGSRLQAMPERSTNSMPVSTARMVR
jgi:hypothetical protein